MTTVPAGLLPNPEFCTNYWQGGLLALGTTCADYAKHELASPAKETEEHKHRHVFQATASPSPHVGPFKNEERWSHAYLVGLATHVQETCFSSEARSMHLTGDSSGLTCGFSGQFWMEVFVHTDTRKKRSRCSASSVTPPF